MLKSLQNSIIIIYDNKFKRSCQRTGAFYVSQYINHFIVYLIIYRKQVNTYFLIKLEKDYDCIISYFFKKRSLEKRQIIIDMYNKIYKSIFI